MGSRANARSRRIVHVNGVALSAESFGDRGAQAVLVVTGAASEAWEDTLCERLASAGRYVIRYDSRAVWRSTHARYGPACNTELDLALDAVGVVDALGVRRVHLVGVASGGAIAQRVAREYPGRVASLTLMSTKRRDPGGDERCLALAVEVPGALLLAVELIGAEPTRAVWDVVVPAILEHTLAAGGPGHNGVRYAVR